MGSKGCCFDNAVAESFFATLKKELIRRRSWPSRHELIGEVFEYIEAFYGCCSLSVFVFSVKPRVAVVRVRVAGVIGARGRPALSRSAIRGCGSAT